uniref:SMC5-SMC6 complex localization factor protein 2 isoform X2 n=1 Tax=Semicossyphus pulcher TaxID=241346 RepID=UPI0037E7ED13
MRRATENQGNTRTLSDYFSPRTKVKGFALQQHSPPHVTSFVHETPMKPSQVPNRLPYPAPRRMLPLQKPDLYQVSPCQDQQHKRTPSSEKLIPGDLNSSSLKRRRESEDCNDSAVKLFRQGENSFKAQTPKPSVCNSLSTSLVPQPSLRHSSVFEQSPKSTDNHLCTKPACGKSTCLELSSTLIPTQSSRALLSPEPCKRRQSSMGAKQGYIERSPNHTLRLFDIRSPSKQGEEHLQKRGVEKHQGGNSSSLFSSDVPQKYNGSSPSFHLGSHHSGHTHRSSSVIPVKTQSKSNPEEENKKFGNSTPKQTSRPNSDSLSCHTEKRSKSAHSRRPDAIIDDISDLFTPDPIVCPSHKTSKPKINEGETKSSTSGNSSSTVTSSGTAVTGSMCRKTQNVTISGSPHAGDTNTSSLSSQDPGHKQISLPNVSLKRVNLENLGTPCSKDTEAKNSPITFSDMQLKVESVKSNEKHSPLPPNNVKPCTLKAASGKSTHPCVQSPRERTTSGGDKQQVNEDPIDVELDFDLRFALDLDLTQSSVSSEDEQLISWQEIMEPVPKIPDTPEKGAFSEPSTPGHHSCKSKTQPLPSNTKSGNYKNSLDQMLEEINTNKKSKEIEMQLLTACNEDLLRIAEYEEAEENRVEDISTEHQEFLQRYSLMSSAIREVPPGEVVFNVKKFGQIFNHDTLQLRRCRVTPEGAAQKALLWSSPAQLRLHVNIGLFQEAYGSHSPCPAKVTSFLFKMMSVHNERMVSESILQTLCDIACNAAYQIVKNKSQKFEVWVPSLADVALVLMNMGASFVTLFPFENLQPPFTEGDLLEDIYIKMESPSSEEEQSTFLEHNCINVLKYLSYCMGLCPRAYSDDELLLLLTVMGRVGLDTQLILLSTMELYPLQYKIVNNIRDWNAMLPRICLALTDLTDDHHNMCLLVQMLPDNTRGKQLRRHLSLSMISKLLDKECTYRPTEEEIQLSELRRFLPRMKPSALLRSMLRPQRDKEDMATLDQQSYYLCYSLLTLANETSNFQFLPAHQKQQLFHLSSELDMHVKCDIRDGEKCLYRSKVKDLVARIHTKWEMLLKRTMPLNGKLYDFWKPPLSVDTLSSSQDEQEVNNNDEREEETSEENEVAMIPEDDIKEEEDDRIDETNKTERLESKPQVHTESKVMDGHIEARNIKPSEMQTGNGVKTEESQHHQEAAEDLVS